MYNEYYQSLVDVGEFGPAKKQFRDILSVTCYNPFQPSYYTHQYSGSNHHDKREQYSNSSKKVARINNSSINNTIEDVNTFNVSVITENAIPNMTGISDDDTADIKDLKEALRNKFDQLQWPSWYKGEQSLENLEEIISDENYQSNFVVGKYISRYIIYLMILV